MKLNLYLITALSTFACSLNACHTAPETKLSQQYETGSLQWQLARKEIDPNTLIHQAILENAADVISFLLSHGVKVDYPDENGMTPLTIAILNRSTDAVKVLLNHGANINPSVKWNNKTLLELAFHMRDLSSVEMLIERGANVNGSGENGWSILSQVIQNGNENPKYIEISKQIINRGAELKAQEVYSAIMFSQNSGNLSILELLIKKGVDLNKEENGWPPLIVEASRRWNTNVIKLLVKSGANVNKIDKKSNEETALIVAISSGDLERVKLLVELGADVNQKVCRNALMTSPIKFSLETQHPEIVQYLLKQGARD